MALGGHRVSCHQSSAELGVSGNRRQPPCLAWLVGGCVGPRRPRLLHLGRRACSGMPGFRSLCGCGLGGLERHLLGFSPSTSVDWIVT